MTEKKGSMTSAMFWMLLISILLFWLPVFGPLIAGVVGGKKAGGVLKGMLSVFLPGILIGAAAFVLASLLSGFPVIGMVAGLGGLSLAAMNVGPLLIGAIIGGALSS